MRAGGYGPARATEADRDNVRSILADAHAQGTLSPAEFDYRSTALKDASTYDQLATLTADLPNRIPAAPPQVYRPGLPYEQQPYEQQPYEPQPGEPPLGGLYGLQPVNVLAVASLLCGVGQIIFWFLTGIPAIVLGHLARRQIKRTGEQGAGLALAGMLLGYAGLGLAIIVALIIVQLVAGHL